MLKVFSMVQFQVTAKKKKKKKGFSKETSRIKILNGQVRSQSSEVPKSHSFKRTDIWEAFLKFENNPLNVYNARRLFHSGNNKKQIWMDYARETRKCCSTPSIKKE